MCFKILTKKYSKKETRLDLNSFVQDSDQKKINSYFVHSYNQFFVKRVLQNSINSLISLIEMKSLLAKLDKNQDEFEILIKKISAKNSFLLNLYLEVSNYVTLPYGRSELSLEDKKSLPQDIMLEDICNLCSFYLIR